jgi:hypothetical protein
VKRWKPPTILSSPPDDLQASCSQARRVAANIAKLPELRRHWNVNMKIVLAGLIIAAAIVQFVLFGVFINLTMILRPFSDMIYWIDSYLSARQNGDVLRYLWSSHNEHHLVTIRLLTALDTAVLKASGLPFVIAATVAATMTALLIYFEFRSDKQLIGPLRALDWLSPMLLLTTAAAVDCSIPINSVYPLSLLFVVTTLVLFSHSGEFARYAGTKRAGALVAAVLASFSNAVGLVIWPALLWLAWRVGASKRWLIGIAAFGSGYGLVYLWTLPAAGPMLDLGHQLNLAHVSKMGDYLLAYLGLPLSRAPGLGLLARALGAGLLLAAVIAILFDAALRRSATRLHLIGIGLMIFALGTAFLAVTGRVDVEQEVKLPVRYSILVAPLHIGLLALILPLLAHLATTSQRQIALLGAATAIAGMLVVMTIVSGRYAMIDSAVIRNAIARFEQTGQVEAGMERIYPDPILAHRMLTELRSQGEAN